MDNTALDKAKSFWQRPEGTAGKMVVLGTAIGGGLLVYKYLPPILEWFQMVFENAIYSVGLGAAALVVTSPIWNSKMRALTSYMFRSGMRALTGWFVTIDPIGILKNYIEDLHKQQGVMDTQIGKLRGTITNLEGIITSNAKEHDHSMKLAGAARTKGQKGVMSLQVRKAGRLEESSLSFQTLLTKLKKLYEFLAKLRESTDIMVQDMESTVEIKERDYCAMRAATGTLTAAMKVMRGDPDKRALFDAAMEHITNDCAERMGMISDFMDTSKGILDTMDLENSVFEDEAMKKLDAMFTASEDHLLGPIAEKIGDPLQREKAAVLRGPASTEDSDVMQLFKKQ